jgi:protein AroM
MPPTLAFVTIGQTPRTDLVPEILSYLPGAVEIVEFGALDGLKAETIGELAPAPGESRLVTRLQDGAQVVLRKQWVQSRLQELLDGLDGEAFTALVLLCTGEFPGLRGPGLFLDAQHLVDHAAAALSTGARRIGVLLPLGEQAEGFHFQPTSTQELVLSHASPYTDDRLEAAALDLSGTDMIVMHCMGYTEAQRRVVARVSGRPTLLARRLVATSLSNLL